MRATVMYGAGDVRVETVPDARLIEPTDALIRVTRAAICGSDLWPYQSMEPNEAGRRMGHEFIGIAEAVGGDVRTIKAGDLVLAPFLYSDGICVFCQEGLHSSCLQGGRYGWDEVDGGQGEAVRVPHADGTLVVLPVGPDDALMPSLLTLTDVMATGHHSAISAKAGPGKTAAVVGDGAVGLCGVLAARRLGAEQVILLGRHPTASRWGRRSAPRISSPSVARKPSSASVSSPAVSAPTPSWSASATGSQRARPLASPARVAPLAASGCLRKRRSPTQCPPCSATSPSAVE